MKKLYSLVCILVSILIIFSLTGCSNGRTNGAVDTLRYNDFSASSDEAISETVCENESFALLWDDSSKQVSFLDKNSGAVWSPAPVGTRETEYNESGMPVKNNPNTQSAIIVHYFDPTTLDEKRLFSSTDAVQDGAVYKEKTDNGIRVTYDFMAYEISVPVEFAIEKDHFSVTVQPGQIYDNGESYVTGISVAPFICGIKNNTEGDWLFIPDGSGAIVSADEIDSVGNIGSKSVYGDDAAIQTFYFNSTEKQIYFPVFGVKNGDSALFGIIESGDSQASIAWNIGSKDVKYSSVYPFFRIRGYNMINPPRGFNSPLTEVQSFSKYINTTPLTVAYYSLSGDEADIFGMAKQYRSYLTKKGLIGNAKASDEKIGVKLIGGVEQKDFVLGVPVTKLYALTTLKDAEEIADILFDKISDGFYFDLVGFGSSGLDSGKPAGGFSIASKLGGNSQLRNFSEQMKKYGVNWFMDFDIISFDKSGGGFSKKNAAVIPNGQVAWMQSFNTVTRNSNNDRSYLIGREELDSAISRLIKKAENMELYGISLDSLSHTKYSDYNSPKYSACGGMSTDIPEIIEKIKRNGYAFLGDAPNGYVAFSSERIIDAPLYSSNYSFTAYDVPFYELVLKGFSAMNSVSLNLCTDSKDALLRCLEAGISPSFTLTANYCNELISSKHTVIYGSDSEEVIRNITELYDSIKQYMESVSGVTMADYSVNGDLRVTKFENGVYAVVNYSENDISTIYGIVPAHGWISGREE